MLEKILIVEDEENILEILSAEFDALGGYQVLQARDGEEALRITSTHNPHVIILDIQLPKINGYEVCKSIKSNPELSRTRILMMSGFAQRSDRSKAIEMGADDYLTKPFDLVSLISRVKILISQT